MRRSLLLLAICLIALSPTFAQATRTQSTQEKRPELAPVLRLFTEDEIADAAAEAGLTLYTEADAVYAIDEASRVAAETAVAAAVPPAVARALADAAVPYSRELWAWRAAAALGALAALYAIVH